jgi:hypothetical protein
MKITLPLQFSRHFCGALRRRALALLTGLALAATLTGCSVVAIGLTAPVMALAIPLFALQMLAGDVERFVAAASALPVGAALDTSFARIVVPADGFVARSGGPVPQAVTLVSVRGKDPQLGDRFDGRFDASSFPTPAGTRTPREALYRQAEISGQSEIIRRRVLVSGAEVTWRGMPGWSFEAVLPVGLDGRPAWCRGILVQRGGTSYFLARSVPLQSAAARQYDPSSPEAVRARDQFRGFLARFEPRGSFAATSAGGSMDLPQ